MGSTSSTSSSVSTLNSSSLSNSTNANQPITPSYNFSVTNTTPPQSEGLVGGMLTPTTIAPSSNIFFIVIMLAVFVLILIFIFKVKL